MLDRITHEKVLSQILFQIYSDKQLAGLLGFKGGTACYYFYDLPRFSTDLDFDLLDTAQADMVYNKIAEILSDFGTVKDMAIKANTLFYLLNYTPDSHNIKVEISLRSNQFDQYEVKHLLGLAVLVMKQECISANKLVAITDRKRLAHRDLFDAWFMLKNNWPVNEEVIVSRTAMDYRQYLKQLLEMIEKQGEINILLGLGEVLDHRQKLWAKQNLLDEFKFLLKLNSK